MFLHVSVYLYYRGTSWSPQNKRFVSLDAKRNRLRLRGVEVRVKHGLRQCGHGLQGDLIGIRQAGRHGTPLPLEVMQFAPHHLRHALHVPVPGPMKALRLEAL